MMAVTGDEDNEIRGCTTQFLVPSVATITSTSISNHKKHYLETQNYLYPAQPHQTSHTPSQSGPRPHCSVIPRYCCGLCMRVLTSARRSTPGWSHPWNRATSSIATPPSTPINSQTLEIYDTPSLKEPCELPTVGCMAIPYVYEQQPPYVEGHRHNFHWYGCLPSFEAAPAPRPPSHYPYYLNPNMVHPSTLLAPFPPQHLNQHHIFITSLPKRAFRRQRYSLLWFAIHNGRQVYMNHLCSSYGRGSCSPSRPL